MMNKKLLLMFGIFFILLSGFVFAIDENDINVQLDWSFDNDNISGSNPLDLTPNNRDGIWW